jgi:septal ring factor EnvC (AmiA/AmiB activator)
MVKQRVQQELDKRLKDQKVVEVDIAEGVYNRVSKWATIFISLCLLPLGAAFYFIYGQYTNLSGLITSSETKAKEILGRATSQAEAAEKTANEASRKSSELNRRIDERSQVFEALDKKVVATLRKVDASEASMRESEERIAKSGRGAHCCGHIERRQREDADRDHDTS